VRFLVIFTAAGLLVHCSPPRQAVDPQDWYEPTVRQLAAIDRDADSAFKSGHPDDAAALIEKGQPLSSRLLGVPHPTMPALEAASDLDDLYGRMLLSNRHYAWARLFFQKNLARWKHWDPPNEESARRLKQAQDRIAECDLHL
jgi:hypothetical protein